MTATLAEIEDMKRFLRALKKARWSGAKRVVFGERDVTYKSDDEMRQIQRELEAEIAGEEAVVGGIRPRRSRSTVVLFKSGY